MKLCEIENFLFQPLGVPVSLIRPTECVCNISNYKICTSYHPSVTMSDRKSWRHTFQARIENVVIKMLWISFRDIRRNKNQFCVGVRGLIFFTALARELVKRTVTTQKKLGVAVADPLGKQCKHSLLVLRRLYVIRVSAERDDHKPAPKTKSAPTEVDARKTQTPIVAKQIELRVGYNPTLSAVEFAFLPNSCS